MSTDIQQFDLLLEGKTAPSLTGKYADCINPSNGEVFARIADADSIDAEIAVSAARIAFDHGQWPHLSIRERGQFLLKIGELIRTNAQELARLESLATGKTLKHATFIDVPTAAETFEYFGNLPGHLVGQSMHVSAPILSQIEREPVGVVVAIIPWNYPLIMTAWKIAPALIAGNAVILKTSTVGAAAIMALAKIIAQAGLPKGVLNVLYSSNPSIGSELVKNSQVDMISFTGSSQTGEKVMAEASRGVKKLVLELGGKSPNIVFADCNWEAAIGGTLSSIFMNGGQMCTAGSRLLVEDKIHDRFVEELVKRAKSLKIGSADNFETEFGPLVSVEHRDHVLKCVEKAKAEGATLACGGKIPEAVSAKGAYIEPTIFTHVRNSMFIAQEEVFGPVLSVIKFSNIDEAVHIANDTRFGLAAMVWSEDLFKANSVAKRLRCGTVWINTYGVFLNEAPFGGYKQSGFGRELGKEGLYEYTQIKHIATDQTPGGKSLVTSWF